MVEKIVYDKLMKTKPQTAAVTTGKERMDGKIKECFDIDICFKELNYFIHIMEQTRQNQAFRHIYSCRKVIGSAIVFCKRVVRKLLKWYIEPICFQQTEFNNAVTPSIGRLTELTSELVHRSDQQKQSAIELNHYIAQMEENCRTEQKATAASIEIAEERVSSLERELYLQKEAWEKKEKSFHNQLCALQTELEEFRSAMENNTNSIKVFQTDMDCLRQKERDIFQKEQEELRSILRINADTIQSLETDMNRLRQMEPSIFLVEQGSVMDTYTTSQSGEDRIVEYITRMLGYQPENITYLDLGANHAKFLSNTYYFYQKGARGVLVEANPALIGELKFYRNEDIILNRCVSTESGETVDFYVLNGDGLSTPDREQAEEALRINPTLQLERVVQVETITPNEILEQYFDGAPTFMNVDIEGKDLEILKSIDFETRRPLVISVEMIPYRTHLVVGEKNQDVLDWMAEKDYIEYAFTGINSIFVDQKQLTGGIRS